jgi:uncharacterized low-complexity protein
MKTSLLLAVAATTLLSAATVDATTYQASVQYSDTSCLTPKYVTYTSNDGTCAEMTCTSKTTMACPSDWLTHSESVFTGSSYLLYEFYSGADCSGSAVASAFKTNVCVSQGDDVSIKAVVASDGSISLYSYSTADCSDDVEPLVTGTATEYADNTCVNSYKFYAVTTSTSKTSTNAASASSLSGMLGSAVLIAATLGAAF